MKFAGSIDTTRFDLSKSGHAVTNVVVGERRRVLIDITEMVKSYLKDPEKNRGLILGSLTGRRDGKFSLRSDVFPGGALARVKFHYDDRAK